MDPRFDSARESLNQGDVSRLANLLKADPTLASGGSVDPCDHPNLLQCLVLTMPPASTLEAMINLIVDHGSPIDGPLIAAAGIDNVRAVAALLDRGASSEGNASWSPLEEAIYWGQAATIDLLLERGAGIHNLRTAAALGDIRNVFFCFDEHGKLIPELAGTVGWPFAPEALNDVRHDPRQILGNAFVHAAAWGRSEVVTYLLDQGAEINLIPAGFDYSGTALHYAALKGRTDVVDLLLSRGADPALPDTKIGRLPEHWAEHEGHTALADHLRQARTTAGTSRS